MPKTCAAIGASCGMASNGCSDTINCGGCPEGLTCTLLNQCVGGAGGSDGAAGAIFPHDLLADLGFVTLRRGGRVQLARLDLGGLVPSAEAERSGLLGVLKRRRWPVPAPVPPRP